MFKTHHQQHCNGWSKLPQLNYLSQMALYLHFKTIFSKQYPTKAKFSYRINLWSESQALSRSNFSMPPQKTTYRFPSFWILFSLSCRFWEKLMLIKTQAPMCACSLMNFFPIEQQSMYKWKEWINTLLLAKHFNLANSQFLLIKD